MTFKLLLFLNPDATDIRHIARYLYHTERREAVQKAYALIGGLKKKGWIISKYEYRLDVLQYYTFQVAYSKRGFQLKQVSLTPNVIADIVKG